MQTPFCERQTIAQTVNSSINLARARLNLLILNPRDATQSCSQNALKVVSDKKKNSNDNFKYDNFIES